MPFSLSEIIGEQAGRFTLTGWWKLGLPNEFGFAARNVLPDTFQLRVVSMINSD